MSFHIRRGKIRAGGADIFYREAGREDAPVIVLFHGFPTASYMFSDLMPILAEKYHVIAPDYPGFGESEMVPRDKFAYTFDHLASVMDDFLTRMHVKKFAMYIFDYGAPIGMRIACKHPDRITAIISQNGNVYEESLGEKWKARVSLLGPSDGRAPRILQVRLPRTGCHRAVHGRRGRRRCPSGPLHA